ncbi:DNA repair protein RecN [Ostreiculturibacter nitratireducens]|uniref:DNA repair protein RecN n=1 Tax=Ostreiculturibacter nitratireducens TaxID=3075226 RepID=UPI0031B621E2
MLRSLDIRDMLIIDRLELEFQPGLNVLTGETGAGKSILLDCLGLVLGWRGRAETVRTGAAQGEVTAVFDLPEGHPAQAVLEVAGLDGGDELILRRVMTADGRKSAYVNDRRTSADVLRTLGETLVELHGQQDDRGLLNPRGHRALLDAFAGAEGALAATRAAWARLGGKRRLLEAAEEALGKAAAEEEFLRHAVAELEELDPKSGEDAELDTERRLMQGAERIREDIARALQALGPEGAEGLMADAARWLDGAAEKAEGRLDEPIAALGRAITELGEATQGVENCLEALTFDPRRLEIVADRLFAIRGLARKHSVMPDELGELAGDLRRKLDAIDGGAAEIDALHAEIAEAAAEYEAAADKLSQLRREAAGRLDAAMAVELPPLKLDRALFVTEVGEGEAGQDGKDAVAFTIATNPGAIPGPLSRIASGGELSRFLLALKVCLARGADVTTMIFDEIDRGVGGATADAVGRRLARLAESAQVLVVTHSPQVAARGAHHWRVQKSVSGGTTTSTVVPLAPEERVDEVARMLSGESVTEAARQAAQDLLAG